MQAAEAHEFRGVGAGVRRGTGGHVQTMQLTQGNSTPASCDAVNGTIAHANAAIDQAVAQNNTAPLTALAGIFDNDNNAGQCTLH